MARDQEWDIKLDGVGLILDNDGLAVRRVQANPFAMKSSAGERSYADLDEWAVFQCDTMHRGMGQEVYGDPSQYYMAYNIDTRFPNKVFSGPHGTGMTMPASVTGDAIFSRFGSKLFMACGTQVFELVTNTWTLRETLTAACTAMAEFNGYFYAAQGISNSMRKTADGTTWADVDGTPAAYRLYVHGGYLYRSLNQVLYYSSDPEATPPTWSSAIYVDDSQYIVESMVTFQNGLIVFKNNGAWRVPGNPGEDDKAYPIGELQWGDAIDSKNGEFCTTWTDGFLYVTNGKGGILRWTGKTVSSVGPDRMSAGVVQGEIVGMVATTNFIYIFLDSDTLWTRTSFLMAWGGHGWHCLVLHDDAAKGMCYFDPGSTKGGYLFLTTHDGTDNDSHRYYMPEEAGDPIDSGDSSVSFGYSTYGNFQLITSKFTAGMHGSFKEFRRLVVWAKNYGIAAGGTQQLKIYYRIDTEANWWTLLSTETVTAEDYMQTFKVDFPESSFTDKTISSVSGTTVELASGSVTTDMAEYEWCYFVDVNEYAQIKSITDSDTFELARELDGAPTASTTIRQGIPWGRHIQFKIEFYSGSTNRTVVLKAWALKYLVNVEDYDMWQASVRVACPRAKRNGQEDRTPVGDQLSRLNEIRRKGRVEFYDEVNESHTVRVSNYSLVPVRQRTDGDEAKAEYTVRLTLLEV